MGGPLMRVSAMLAFQSASWAKKSSMSWKLRPGGKLRLTYLTPDSTLPLVCARYARRRRGSKPQ